MSATRIRKKIRISSKKASTTKKNSEKDEEIPKRNPFQSNLSLVDNIDKYLKDSDVPESADFNIEYNSEIKSTYKETDPLNDIFPVKRYEYLPGIIGNRKNVISKARRSNPNFVRQYSTVFDKYQKDKGCKTFLLTLNILKCEAPTAEEAWNIMPIREAMLIKYLKTLPYVKFALSAFEMHTGVSGTKNLEDESEDIEPKDNNKGRFVYLVNSYEEMRAEVLRVFSTRDEELKCSPAYNNAEAIHRMLYYLHSLSSNTMLKQKLLDLATTYEVIQYDEGAVQSFIEEIDSNRKLIEAAYKSLLGAGYLVVTPNDLTKSNKSLKGYPHIHIAIVCKYTNVNQGRGVDKSIIEYDIYKSGLFIDARIDKKGNKPTDNLGIHHYVLKQTFQDETYVKLQRNPVTFFDIDKDPDNARCIRTIMDNLNITRFIDNIPEEIPDYKLPVRNFTQVILGDYNTPIDWSSSVDKPFAANEYEQFTNYIIEYMESNKIYLEDIPRWRTPPKHVNLFQFQEGSTMSVKYYGTTVNLLIDLVDTASLSRQKQTYGKKISNEMNGQGQKLFPKITMDYSWLEFKDFYFHIPTRTIFEHQDRYVCFAYFPEIDLRTFKDIARGKIVPKHWHNLLKHNGFTSEDGNLTLAGLELITSCYNLLIFKNLKDKTPLIIGPNDCGKTTFIDAFLAGLPTCYYMTLANSRFDLSKLARAGIIKLDECERLSEFGISDASLKKFCDTGQEIAPDVKHQDALNSYVFANIVFTGNSSDWFFISNSRRSMPSTSSTQTDEQLPNPALSNRLQYTEFKSIDKDPKIRHEMLKYEPGIILLYVCLASNGYNYNVENDQDKFKETVVSNIRFRNPIVR